MPELARLNDGVTMEQLNETPAQPDPMAALPPRDGLSGTLTRSRGGRGGMRGGRLTLGATRCVFATIGLYTRPMNHSQTALAGAPAVHTAFILRTSWDSSAQQWCILVKPIAGDDARLFGDMEAAFLYIEMLMAERVARLGIQTTGARCTSGDKLQETDR